MCENIREQNVWQMRRHARRLAWLGCGQHRKGVEKSEGSKVG
jgi:hypothetical protein